MEGNKVKLVVKLLRVVAEASFVLVCFAATGKPTNERVPMMFSMHILVLSKVGSVRESLFAHTANVRFSARVLFYVPIEVRLPPKSH